MHVPTRIRIAVFQLEDRLTPSVKFLLDFGFDTGFFTNHGDRIATVRAAAADLASRFSDTLAAIPYPSAAGDHWTAEFDRPGGVGQAESVENLLVPADTIVVFVGARELLGPKYLTSTGRQVFGSADWNTLVQGRGQANSFGTGATDFSPWGGSLTFDSISNWHNTTDPPGNDNETDLYMAAQKGLTELMGFGASEAWFRVASGEQFFGPKATAVYGAATVPLSSNNRYWQDGVLSEGQRTLMDENLEDGERIKPTKLDLAGMQDIGWTLVDTTVPPPPVSPAAPPVPTIPPAPIRSDTVLSVVGTGPGTTSQFTVNDAESFVQLAKFNPYAGLPGGGDFTGGVRATTADLNQDGVQDIIVGPGPGIPTEVKVYSGKNFPVSPDTSLFTSGYAFETSFTGGVFLSAGDFNGDGVPDIAVSPDQGGGPRVRIVSGKDRTLLADFLGIEDPNFRGGARTAAGDLNGDGVADLVVAAGFGGGPRIAIFDGTSLAPGKTPKKLVNDFFLFEDTLRNGAFVTAGDLNGDGFADLVGGGGPGGAPRVYALDGKALTQQNGAQTVLANFFAGDTESRGGVTLIAKDIDGDRHADIITGAGEGQQSVVTTYLGSDLTPNGTPPVYQKYLVFDPSFTGGVFVG